MNDSVLEATLAIDRELVRIAPKIRVLSSLSWPTEVEEAFLTCWRAGRPELPQIEPSRACLPEEVPQLEAVMGRCDRGHPVGRLL